MNAGRAGSPIRFAEALRVWTRVALQSFGGPAGQIAVMHRILVEEKRWIGEARFLHALNYCMLLPGPEAQQLATYVGWLLHGYRGGLAAGILFVLPGFLAILGLSILYASFRDLGLVAAVFFGLKAAVVAVVAQAVIRIGQRVLRNPVLVAFAAAAFVAIFFAGVPFPAIVVGAGLVGLSGGRLWPRAFRLDGAGPGPAPQGGALDAMLEREPPAHALPSWRRAAAVAAVCGALWLAPFLALRLLPGGGAVLLEEAALFSKAALVTFGGAYAALAYVAQAAVEWHGWLTPGEMLDGLGMAETTPGPLIMVVQFVGFMAAFRNPGALDPMAAGVLASVVTTWVTFVPCFLWIFLGGPYVESLRGNRHLTAALSGITAAVVGVILNLAIWFALHTLFGEVRDHRVDGLRLLAPVWSSVDPAALVLAAGALVALIRWRWGLLTTLGACTALGMAHRLAWG